MPLRSPFKRESVDSLHVQLLYLWDPPKHFHGDHAVAGMLLALAEHSGITRAEALLPMVGLLHWVFLAPGLPISLADTFSDSALESETLPLRSSSLNKCQICIS